MAKEARAGNSLARVILVVGLVIARLTSKSLLGPRRVLETQGDDAADQAEGGIEAQ